MTDTGPAGDPVCLTWSPCLNQSATIPSFIHSLIHLLLYVYVHTVLCVFMKPQHIRGGPGTPCRIRFSLSPGSPM